MVPIALFTIAVAVYWTTAYPTITWWDSSQYSLAAATLGVTSAPGSLLLTMLGSLVSKIPPGLDTAYQLNLFAGVLAAACVCLVYAASVQIAHIGSTEAAPTAAARIAAAAGALAFGCSATIWTYAIQFTPYVLTAVFTGLIFLVMLRWWVRADRADSWRELALLTFLFGLDFSVHRTNALLIPGAVLWILVRHPRSMLLLRSWAAALLGMCAGLSFQLLVIPLSANTQSVMNMSQPDSWTRFWDYASLAERGGGFLVELWPRNAALLTVQVADFLHSLAENFMRVSGELGPLGVLPAIAAVAGFRAIWVREKRLAVAMGLLIATHALVTIAYFNIPANYFRTLDRHYLPVFVVIGVLVAYGMLALLGQAASLFSQRPAALRTVLAGTPLLLVPATQIATNWRAHDASKQTLAHEYAVNALAALPPRAIYFTAGDNDTFPVLYVQAVEGVRPDVQLVNLSMANADWYAAQIMRQDPDFPFSLSPTALAHPDSSHWTDSRINVRVEGSAAQYSVDAETMPESIELAPRTITGSAPMRSEVVVLDIVRTNRWRRPVAFAGTVGEEGLGWLQPYSRLDGLHRLIVPVANPTRSREVLRRNLLEQYDYSGVATEAQPVDDMSRIVVYQYLVTFRELARAERDAGHADGCSAVTSRYFELFDSSVWRLPAAAMDELRNLCQ